MHGLDIIILRNAEAAGRELAHIVNDGGSPQAIEAIEAPKDREEYVAFVRGYRRGRVDGYEKES